MKKIQLDQSARQAFDTGIGIAILTTLAACGAAGVGIIHGGDSWWRFPLATIVSAGLAGVFITIMKSCPLDFQKEEWDRDDLMFAALAACMILTIAILFIAIVILIATG